MAGHVGAHGTNLTRTGLPPLLLPNALLNGMRTNKATRLRFLFPIIIKGNVIRLLDCLPIVLP